MNRVSHKKKQILPMTVFRTSSELQLALDEFNKTLPKFSKAKVRGAINASNFSSSSPRSTINNRPCKAFDFKVVCLFVTDATY